MSLSSLTVAQARHLLLLVEKKESIVAEIAKVEAAIADLEKAPQVETKSAPKVKAPVLVKAVPAAKPKKTKLAKEGRKGGLKDKILAILEKAGDKGAGVVDIAKTLGVKVGNVHVWFSTTGKKVSEIKKTGPGVYALKAGK